MEPGKTTTAMTLLPDHLKMTEFVNADSIAAGLSPFNPSANELLAGRLMLQRIRLLIDQGTGFAFETTMASRVFSGLLSSLQGREYRLTTVFVYLNSPNLALARVADRVAKGGHSVPRDIIERRFERGLRNFLKIYIPLSGQWYIHDNSGPITSLVAEGTRCSSLNVYNNETWEAILRKAEGWNEPA